MFNIYKMLAQQGDGLLKRDDGVYPPPMRKLLSQIGSEKVTSIKLLRTPLSKATTFLLNLASLGQLKQKMKETGIDTLFHLSMLINDKYEFDKQEVVKLVKNSSAIKSDTQTLDVPLANLDVTIDEFIDKTRKRMGDNRFSNYEARSNNCSVLISNTLQANGLNSSSADDFINQKTEELFNSFPKFTEILTNLATEAGAVVERQVYGEGANNVHKNTVITNSALSKTMNKIKV